MGILPAQALATSVLANPGFYWIVPDSWSLADAATVPVVYSTAYYALVIRGQIRKGEKACYFRSLCYFYYLLLFVEKNKTKNMDYGKTI